jgi:pimeloyl-ACP methyl ester carboxylesterase
VASLEPEPSESTVPAIVPPDVCIESPPPGLPVSITAWCGAWSGWADQGRTSDVKLIVEKVSADGATVVCARASARRGPQSERVVADWYEGELQANLQDGAFVRFRMRNPDVVELLWRDAVGRMAGVLTQQYAGGHRVSEYLPTGALDQEGRAICLEMVTYKPPGHGPFPTLLFHHGSAGMGNDSVVFTSTVTSPALARFFNDRGWMVVFPQRRGRGKSGGVYAEGLEPDGSGYSHRPERALEGFEHALHDVECAVAHLLERPDVDHDRLLIGGHSRGGFLALAAAGARPGMFQGVLNFVGGWVDEQATADEINGGLAMRGAGFTGPTLWLYADNDPFYGLVHSRKNFGAFLAAGGQGSFRVLATEAGQDGHNILGFSGLWGPFVQPLLGVPGRHLSNQSG